MTTAPTGASHSDSDSDSDRGGAQLMAALDPSRWTVKTQEAFQNAVEQARSAGNPEVTPEHLLGALLSQSEGVVLPVLEKAGLAPMAVRNRLTDALAKLPKAYGGT